MVTDSRQRLELTWFNKDRALIPTETGKYGYSWVDPSDPRYCETHYLEYVETVTGVRGEKQEGITYSERADLAPQDDNLLVLGESGDVLEALTRVAELKAKYLGKVKCVYIDPPFNTAQTFANYEDNLEHSVWLTMMRDRLVHLRNLLSNDGSIWVHLDYAENHRMRVLLDEVFGSGNFIAELIWQKADSGRNDATYFSTDQDTIIVYRKTEDFSINRLPRPESMNARFTNPDNDPKGRWAMADPCAPDAPNNQPMVYAIEHPITGELMYPAQSSCWRLAPSVMFEEMSKWADYELRDIDDRQKRAEVSGVPIEEAREVVPAMMLAEPLETAAEKVKAKIASGETLPELVFTKGGLGRIMRKSRIPQRGVVPRTLLLNDEVSHSRGAKKEIVNLFPGVTAFSTPKPERLLERVIQVATDPGDIILDVFAGSGTTAAVAQKMGRRWVTCELVEDTFNKFTRPRLEKVVRGKDQGGITLTKGERIDATDNGLPEGLEPDDAQKLTSLLNKAIKEQPELKKSADIKKLKQLVKTRKSPDTVNWLGGGGFTVAHLSPTCYDYLSDANLTVLTEHATGYVLKKSVAAHLGFTLVDDQPPFTGKRNREYLAVIEGVLNEEKINDIMMLLPEGHSAILAATEVAEDARRQVRNFKNGSRVVHVPFDMFRTTDTRQEK
ncbi:site-specific DNA-methyltransferase [Corynebacterium antarcticum]|uniref:site-specific DNA-methyltransferase n=1 Tax=Corynebacterium antarcticum TaxID=2800405 RepID=UPI002004CD13|nr:site-specific DNA-methyltransferase [Corynebacterium antarcticum]MCK7660046.1 site-specific DNA-methyltransferase [Corynebacterium antarcticum]